SHRGKPLGHNDLWQMMKRKIGRINHHACRKAGDIFHIPLPTESWSGNVVGSSRCGAKTSGFIRSPLRGLGSVFSLLRSATVKTAGYQHAPRGGGALLAKPAVKRWQNICCRGGTGSHF